jgi:hypothetical protein
MFSLPPNAPIEPVSVPEPRRMLSRARRCSNPPDAAEIGHAHDHRLVAAQRLTSAQI